MPEGTANFLPRGQEEDEEEDDLDAAEAEIEAEVQELDKLYEMKKKSEQEIIQQQQYLNIK